MDEVNRNDAAASAPRTIGIAQVYRSAISSYRSQVAIVGEDGYVLSYGQLGDLSDRLARLLMTIGVSRGQRIAVLSDPCPEWAIVYVACAKIGVTVAGLNTRLTPSDIDWCINDSQARVVFYDPAYRGVVEQIRSSSSEWPSVEFDARRPGTPGTPTMLDLIDAAGAGESPDLGTGQDIHTVIYTSGTTGRPKGAMISQAAAAVRALRVSAWFGLGTDDAFLGWPPMFHTGGEEPLNATLLSGGRYITHRRSVPSRLVESVERDRATWTWLLPGNFAEFLAAASPRPESIESLKFGGGYGNLLPTRLIDELIDYGSVFFDLLGQTEASLLIASNCVSEKGETLWHKQPTPLLGLRVAGDDGEALPVGVPGELLLRGPSIMSGYLNNEAATAEVFAGGWLHTGDVVAWNEDGTIVFTDRKKYLIKTGGENVYPAEVEAVLSTHPAVAEVCVVGAPDERWGETVKAFVVLTQGHTVELSELDAHCRASLAAFKRPRIIEVLDDADVPRSATGKVVRAELANRRGRELDSA